MKKFIAIILAVVMLALMCSCESTSDPIETTETQQQKTETTSDNLISEVPVPEEETQCTYLSKTVSSKMEEYFKNDFYHFSACSTEGAPYALQDVFTISDAKVLSITIPVYRVTSADSNGNFVFTLYVFDNSLQGLKKAPIRTYSLKLNQAQYGFGEHLTVNRFVKVDLTSYNIELSDNETLAWFNATDTIIPAFISVTTSSARVYLSENAPAATGFFQRVGTENMLPSNGTLLMDFEFDRDDLNKEALEYDELIKVLKEKYSGKYVSVVGDSISTYENISNNNSYNSTTGSNEIYYKSTTLASWRCTYWGKLIADLDMNLCVNNARSGKTVYGVPGLSYTDSSIFRATELDNDNKTPNDPSDDINPDVILFYQGINDITLNSPFGDLYDLLKNANESVHADIVETWFAKVLFDTRYGTNIVHGETITTFEQAYAMTLYKMTNFYPDAVIYCLDLIENVSKSPEVIDKYNMCIHAIAEYFEVNLVEHRAESGIRVDNYHAYMADGACLHPNPSGFQLMAKVIMKKMIENID